MNATTAYEVKRNAETREWDVIGTSGTLYYSCEKKAEAVKLAIQSEREDLIGSLKGRIEGLSLATLRTLAARLGA